jgi:hypothetical protein
MVSCARVFRSLFAAPSRAASAASVATFSAVQRVVGGAPQTRPIASHETHFPSGSRYPGPPLSPHAPWASVALPSDSGISSSTESLRIMKDDQSARMTIKRGPLLRGHPRAAQRVRHEAVAPTIPLR